MKHEVVQAILAAIEQDWPAVRLTLVDGTKLSASIVRLETLNDRPHIQVIESNRVKHLPVDDIAEVIQSPN
jgi:hypothetical protein